MTQVSQPVLPLNLSVTPRDLASWEDEKARLEADLSALQVRIERVERRIATAKTLFALLEDEPTKDAPALAMLTPALPRAFANPGEVEAAHGQNPAHERRSTVINSLSDLVQRVGQIAPYQAKDRLSEEAGGDVSEKAFYNAISRLSARGVIAKHNGWLFTPQSLAAYLTKVEAGEIHDEKPKVPTRSPMGDAVIAFIEEQPGRVSKDVIAHLRADAEFAAALTPNVTIAYNIISRLVKRHQIIKRDGKLYPLEHNANEPPNDNVAGGSDASEGASSLTINP